MIASASWFTSRSRVRKIIEHVSLSCSHTSIPVKDEPIQIHLKTEEDISQRFDISLSYGEAAALAVRLQFYIDKYEKLT